jgi:hypothetical protein
MKITDIIAIIAVILCGGSLASIQIRKIIKGELFPFGPQAFKDAAKIELDKFDKKMLLLSGISFIVCIVFAVMSY